MDTEESRRPAAGQLVLSNAPNPIALYQKTRPQDRNSLLRSFLPETQRRGIWRRLHHTANMKVLQHRGSALLPPVRTKLECFLGCCSHFRCGPVLGGLCPEVCAVEKRESETARVSTKSPTNSRVASARSGSSGRCARPPSHPTAGTGREQVSVNIALLLGPRSKHVPSECTFPAWQRFPRRTWPPLQLPQWSFCCGSAMQWSQVHVL